jgi:phospholipid N-methyltransferase
MSAALLLIHDETSTGERTNTVTLTLASERVTARELLRRRIQQEVADYNASQPEYFRGLVQPTDAERVLNGYRVHKDRLVDWREQFESAIQAFARNGFLMLAGDRQIEDLDAEILVVPGLQVSFIKLVPLVGG